MIPYVFEPKPEDRLITPGIWGLGILAAFAAVGALLLGGCSSSQPVENGGDTSIGLKDAGAHFWQDLGNGTKVQCWFITQNYGSHGATGGPTCDWVAYHRSYDPK